MCKHFRDFGPKGLHMIRDSHPDQLALFGPEDFQTPFGRGLDSSNRWVRWAHQIPWQELAAVYHATLKSGGRPAKPARLMIGALLIKHRLGLSDVETIEQLRENPYLQYFCGFQRYQHEAAFAPTLFVKLRQRLGADQFAAFEQMIIDQANDADKQKPNAAADDGSDDEPSSSDSGLIQPADSDGDGHTDVDDGAPAPQGRLIVDASVAEQKIRYPTDVSLLNEARESAEALVDGLWDQLRRYRLATGRKPRMYPQRARADFLNHSKKRRPGARVRRHARRQQLQYLRRDLKHIDRLLDAWQTGCPGAGLPLAWRQQYRLWVIREVHRQQAQLHNGRARRIDDRIVSLHQPHVRPMVRGRAGHPVEFGSKFSVSLVNGIACVDRLRWDAFNEAGDLIAQCQAYKRRHGHYPAKVLADGVYGNRANRRWLKAHGITFAGKPLGRPPKRTREEQKAVNAQRRADACARIPIEGKFGQGKGAYGLARIAARRADTSQAWIRSIFLVMNLLKLARLLFWLRVCYAYHVAWSTWDDPKHPEAVVTWPAVRYGWPVTGVFE